MGQGVFNNPPVVLQKSLQKFYDAIKGFGIRAYVHAFTPKIRKNLESLLSQEEIPFRNMNRDQFQLESLLSPEEIPFRNMKRDQAIDE